MKGLAEYMKLSFSTLGCPEWSWADIYAVARDLGYQGVEVRGIGREMFAPNMKIFSHENIEKTKKTLSDAKLSIPILTTAAYLSDPSALPLAEFEVLAYAQLAEKLGVKYVRVMGEKTPEPCGEGDVDEIAAQYARLCDMVKPTGVTLLIETNGILADSRNMKRVLERADRENSGVIWDINHPCRFFSEEPKTTAANIGKYVRHVHVKDSKLVDGKVKYVLMGYGDLSVESVVRELSALGYDGFYSYEWVKRWAPELEGSGIAFHSYAEYMKTIALQ